MLFLLKITILFDPKQKSVVLKREKKKGKRKKKVPSSFCNFSYRTIFSFPLSLLSICLLFCSVLPFFLAFLFPVGQQKFPGQKSAAPPPVLPLCVILVWGVISSLGLLTSLHPGFSVSSITLFSLNGEWEVLSCGVPQETEFGPIIFNTLINDASDNSITRSLKYVDDLSFVEVRPATISEKYAGWLPLNNSSLSMCLNTQAPRGGGSTCIWS